MDSFQRVLPLRWRAPQGLEDRHPFQTTEEGKRRSSGSSPCASPPPSVASNISTRPDAQPSAQIDVNDTIVGQTSISGTHSYHSPTPSATLSRTQLPTEKRSSLEGVDDHADPNMTERKPRSSSPESINAAAPHQPGISSSSPRPSRTPNRKARHKPLFKLYQSKSGASKKPSGWKTLRPALVLENSGSVARDHLASERTFLAYVRTSLALASTGVALVQLFTIADLTSRAVNPNTLDVTRKLQRFARPLGVTSVLLALIVLGIAAYRYFVVQHALPQQKFPVARISIAFISFVLASLVIVIFGALLSGRV